MLPIDLTGKIAVVTGASGQLGRVLARTLARCGADVALHYFRPPRRRAVAVRGAPSAGGARHDGPGRRHPAGVDPGHGRRSCAHPGAPHILVTNAVIQYQPWTSVLEQPMADYESQFRASVLQNVLMAQAFVPEMIRHR